MENRSPELRLVDQTSPDKLPPEVVESSRIVVEYLGRQIRIAMENSDTGRVDQLRELQDIIKVDEDA